MKSIKKFLTLMLFIAFSQFAYNAPYKILEKAELVDNKDGTISDKNTLLMWTKSCDLNKDGKIDSKDKLTLPQAIEYAKNANTANYSDWRLPNIRELYSLIDFDGIDINPLLTKLTPDIIPFIDTKFFDFGYGDLSANERLIDAQFATTTTYTSTTMFGSKTMFGVNFADGRIKGYGYEKKRNRAAKGFYVYLVRGNPDYSKNKFVDNKDGTVSDISTNLMWTKNDSKKGLDWEQAQKVAQDMDFAGYSDWRMPTVKELQSIIDYSRSPDYTDSAAIDPIFNCTKIINEAKQNDYPCFWSSTVHKVQQQARRNNNNQSANYLAFGRAMGYMNGQWLDVHGAGAQRSDPKTGNPALYPQGKGPQGDAIRIYNYLRPVRDILATDKKAATPVQAKTEEATLPSKPSKLPNIIIFLADDFGFGSLNINGAQADLVQTPNMNMLAQEGINFTNAQTASSVCSPTRYAVLTGIYPWRVKEHQAGAWGHSPQLIKQDTLTIQKMLKSKGYATGMVGKWHLGYGTSTSMPDFRYDYTKTGINATGFDYSWAIAASHGDISAIWLENDKIWGLRSMNNVDNGYCASKQKPYHYYDAPLRKDDEVIATVTTKAIDWLKTLDPKQPFFLYFANPAIHEPITPSAKNKGKSKIGAYGDFIMDLDDSLGEVISYLKSTNQYDNTLIIFTSDNGGVTAPQRQNMRQNMGQNNMRGNMQRPNAQRQSNSPRAFIHEFQNAGFKANGNLNSGKSSQYEGGSRVPFIVKWGKHLPQGASSNEVFGLVDIFATIAHIVDYKLDQSSNARDSQNVIEIWQGKDYNRQDLVTISQSGVRTIRNNGIKYIDGINREALTGRRLSSKGANSPQPEAMYDLNQDLGETKSILLENKDLAQALKKRLEEISK